MNIIAGSIAYLSIVTTVIVAAVAGVASVERPQPQVAAPVLASGSADEGLSREERRRRALEAMKADADRVPVWIAPTAKYEYTPVPVDHARRPSTVSAEVRGAMARSRDHSALDGRRAIERSFGATRVESGRALGFARSRDNDPFYRD